MHVRMCMSDICIVYVVMYCYVAYYAYDYQYVKLARHNNSLGGKKLCFHGVTVKNWVEHVPPCSFAFLANAYIIIM